MTVAEFIEHLQTIPQDFEVYVKEPEVWGSEPISGIDVFHDEGQIVIC